MNLIPPPLVEIKDVCFSFPNKDKPVLDKISLRLQHQQQLGKIAGNRADIR